MKATMMIPDELYRSVKAKSALLGLTVREVTVDLFRKWVTEDEIREADEAAAADWVAEWLRHRIPAGEPGPTAREILEQGRDRLAEKGSVGRAKPARKEVPSVRSRSIRGVEASEPAGRAKGSPGGKPRPRSARRADR
jgi:hypothetical protein